MFKTIAQSLKSPELRKKILWTLLLLFLYRIGTWLPTPGIKPELFRQSLQGSGKEFLGLLSSLSGGALSNGAILALGVGPYITSSIVVQLLTIAIPSLERLSKQGDEGRRKIAVITRYVALAMALAQSIAIVASLGTGGNIQTDMFGASVPSIIVYAMVVITLTAGAMFTVWLGDKITEIGIGNGMSLLIFVGIVATGVKAFYESFIRIANSTPAELGGAIIQPVIFVFTLLVIFLLIVYVDLAERRIPVTYAKQVKGNKMYGGQSANIPIKINSVGVMPIIFASSLLLLPQMLASIFWQGSGFETWYATWLGAGSWLYSLFTALLILGFSYFYASLSFNPEDVSRQIQQNGGFILGYRPGPPTRDYLKRVHNRITFFGALFLMFMALAPTIIFMSVMPEGSDSLIGAFTSTGLLIVVSVALEFDKQLQAQMLVKNYKGFLK